ncbi:uncharacterized protein GIQ15_01844 [Arthroderma uncinatum]|uniref:uncharacterized protein n=1 Tax=Arthroderma uncinatum TaxID=74035 RepID=UPI00144A5677|nr:uncharacterized protein GIQ15_01844 [Arthroderma uncinatum]KAF3492327.1 hypothetical protein GIQ15_01844 [Arthroderma uncinatum]
MIVEESLQSKEHRELLDTIDKLRSQGISRYVDLPQIIVCGDQSSGKSSVLEAISGMSFPTKDNLCTRFATELILRRSPASALHISIVPGPDRSDDEKEALRSFSCSASVDDQGLGEIVEKAKEAMGLSSSCSSSRVFSSDVLRVELSGSQQPHLTMVDLPGLFAAGNSAQSDEDAELVKKLVLSYMRSPRSIILAVVSAKSDFALQSVTKHTRDLDPLGMRTLGLITKPDTLDVGSENERSYIDLAQNNDVKFRLGWHVLRNRDFLKRDTSTAERNQAEAEFFAQGIWTCLDPADTGVNSLRYKLSQILKDQILTQLPNVLWDIELGIKDCQAKLEKLGASRVNIEEQRHYLLQISHSFHTHIKAAVAGVYNDQFFGSAKTDEGYRKRLRAVVQNTLLDFARTMQSRGHFLEIVDEAPAVHDLLDGVPKKISRDDPHIVGDLFKEQCQPWKGLVDSFTQKIYMAAHFTIRSALNNAADEATATVLLQEVILPGLQGIKRSLDSKVAEILEHHEVGHPITYNHYLTDNVQKAQSKRRKEELEELLKEVLGPYSLDSGVYSHQFHAEVLLSRLVERTEANMDRYASNAAIDMMEAYYKVALKRMIDDVSVLAIEACLMNQLPGLFSPKTACSLPDDAVRRIAAESPRSIEERMRLKEALAVLETGYQHLSRLNTYPSKPDAITEISSVIVHDNTLMEPDLGIPSPPGEDDIDLDRVIIFEEDERPHSPENPLPELGADSTSKYDFGIQESKTKKKKKGKKTIVRTEGYES